MAYAYSRNYSQRRRSGVMGSIVRSALLGTALVLVGRMFTGNRNKQRSGDGAALRAGEGSIRTAGPSGMRDEPQRTWTRQDQALDESFPASDPPGQGIA